MESHTEAQCHALVAVTGFKLGQFSDTDMLTMDAKITFPDQGMKDAFQRH